MNLKKKKKLIKRFFKKEISLNENLFDRGYLDSLKVIDLISFLEKNTKKKIAPHKITQKTFVSIKNIIKII